MTNPKNVKLIHIFYILFICFVFTTANFLNLANAGIFKIKNTDPSLQYSQPRLRENRKSSWSSSYATINSGLLRDLSTQNYAPLGSSMAGFSIKLKISKKNEAGFSFGLQSNLPNDIRQPTHQGYPHSDLLLWIPKITSGPILEVFRTYVGYQAFFNYEAKYQMGIYKMGIVYQLLDGLLLTADLGYARHSCTKFRDQWMPEIAIGVSVRL